MAPFCFLGCVLLPGVISASADLWLHPKRDAAVLVDIKPRDFQAAANTSTELDRKTDAQSLLQESSHELLRKSQEAMVLEMNQVGKHASSLVDTEVQNVQGDEAAVLREILVSLGMEEKKLQPEGDHCHWPGITCHNETESPSKAKHVKNISLPEQGLLGGIAPNISSLRYLEIVDFADQPVTGDIAVFNNLNLSQLSLSSTEVHGDLHALEGMTNLNWLGLAYTRIHGDLASLVRCATLKCLFLRQTAANGSLSVLRNLPQLEKFDFRGTEVTGDIAVLKGFEKQYVLMKLSSSAIYGNMSALGEMPKLKKLFLGSSSKGDRAFVGDISSLKASRNLKELSLVDGRFSGDIAAMRDFQKLESLDLTDTDVHGDFASLRGLGLLKWLVLDDCREIHGNLSDLAGIKTLVEISLGRTKAHGELKAVGSLPELLTLSVPGTKITFGAPSQNMSEVKGWFKVLNILEVDECPLGVTIDTLLTQLGFCQGLGMIKASRVNANGMIPDMDDGRFRIGNNKVIHYLPLADSLSDLEVSGNNITEVLRTGSAILNLDVSNNPHLNSIDETLLRDESMFLGLTNSSYRIPEFLFTSGVFQKGEVVLTVNETGGYKCNQVCQVEKSEDGQIEKLERDRLRITPEIVAPNWLCECLETFHGKGTRCVKCPEDQIGIPSRFDNYTTVCACPNGSALVRPGWPRCYKCLGTPAVSVDRCPGLGGFGSRCGVGYNGSLCSACSEGFHGSFDGTCSKCPEHAQEKLLLLVRGVASLVLVVGLAAALVWFKIHRSHATGATAGSAGTLVPPAPSHRTLRFAELKRQASFLLIFIQLVGVLYPMSVQQPSAAPGTTQKEEGSSRLPELKVFQLMQFDLHSARDLFKVQCMMGYEAGTTLEAIGQPFILPVLCSLILVAASLVGKLAQGIAAALALSASLYVGSVSSSVALLRCIKIDGTKMPLPRDFHFRERIPFLACRETSSLGTFVQLASGFAFMIHAVVIPGVLLIPAWQHWSYIGRRQQAFSVCATLNNSEEDVSVKVHAQTQVTSAHATHNAPVKEDPADTGHKDDDAEPPCAQGTDTGHEDDDTEPPCVQGAAIAFATGLANATRRVRATFSSEKGATEFWMKRNDISDDLDPANPCLGRNKAYEIASDSGVRTTEALLNTLKSARPTATYLQELASFEEALERTQSVWLRGGAALFEKYREGRGVVVEAIMKLVTLMLAGAAGDRRFIGFSSLSFTCSFLIFLTMPFSSLQLNVLVGVQYACLAVCAAILGTGASAWAFRAIVCIPFLMFTAFQLMPGDFHARAICAWKELHAKQSGARECKEINSRPVTWTSSSEDKDDEQGTADAALIQRDGMP